MLISVGNTVTTDNLVNHASLMQKSSFHCVQTDCVSVQDLWR